MKGWFNFVSLVVLTLTAFLIGAFDNWYGALWFVITVGLACFVLYALVDAVRAVAGWINRPRNVHVRIERESYDDVVDAEVVEEGDGKWWRV